MVFLYRERLSALVRKHVLEATTKLKTVSLETLSGAQITDVRSWGKYLFFVFGNGDFYLRIHWGMFGFYLLDKDRPDKAPTAEIFFADETVLRLYSVSLRLVEGVPDAAQYDPEADIMNAHFSPQKAIEKLRALPPETGICDALMNQEILAGVGNAIKNEALFACHILPQRTVSSISEEALEKLIEETQQQSLLFAEERRQMTHEYGYPWTRIFRRKVCPDCGSAVQKAETGEGKRVSFWCEKCQG